MGKQEEKVGVLFGVVLLLQRVLIVELIALSGAKHVFL